MENKDQGQEKKQAEIPTLLMQIEKALEEQGKMTTRLLEKVNPLMHEETNPDSPKLKAEGAKTEIGVRLQSFLVRIDDTTESIKKMFYCLEI